MIQTGSLPKWISSITEDTLYSWASTDSPSGGMRVWLTNKGADKRRNAVVCKIRTADSAREMGLVTGGVPQPLKVNAGTEA